jgi:hypothetical protein
MKIDLPPGIEVGLEARAAAEGVGLPEYVARLLTGQVTSDAKSSLSPAERTTAWREAAKGSPKPRLCSVRPSAAKTFTALAAE